MNPVPSMSTDLKDNIPIRYLIHVQIQSNIKLIIYIYVPTLTRKNLTTPRINEG